MNEELCGVFSQRSQQIKATMAERGVSGPVAASIVTLDTRQVKQHVAREVLFDQWQAKGRALGWSTAEAKRVFAAVKERTTPSSPVWPRIKQLVKTYE